MCVCVCAKCIIHTGRPGAGGGVTLTSETTERPCSTSFYLFSFGTGTWLGNPTDSVNKVEVDVDRATIRAAKATATTPERLSVNLLQALFSLEERATGNCTPPERRVSPS